MCFSLLVKRVPNMAEHLTDCKYSWFVSSTEKVLFSFHVCLTQSVYWSDCQQDYAKNYSTGADSIKGADLGMVIWICTKLHRMISPPKEAGFV